MATEKQVKANRKNAARSTGPKTEAGKSVVAANARQHGVLSRELVLPGENSAEYDALLDALIAEFQPQGVFECLLVERLAVSFWRQRRLVRAEAAQLEMQRREGRRSAQDLARMMTGAGMSHVISAMRTNAAETGLTLADLDEELREISSLEDMGLPDEWDMLAEQAPRLVRYLLAEADVESAESWIEETYGNWQEFFSERRRVISRELARLQLDEAQTWGEAASLMPKHAETLIRYQSAIDNEIIKIARALREHQARSPVGTPAAPGAAG